MAQKNLQHQNQIPCVDDVFQHDPQIKSILATLLPASFKGRGKEAKGTAFNWGTSLIKVFSQPLKLDNSTASRFGISEIVYVDKSIWLSFSSPKVGFWDTRFDRVVLVLV